MVPSKHGMGVTALAPCTCWAYCLAPVQSASCWPEIFIAVPIGFEWVFHATLFDSRGTVRLLFLYFLIFQPLGAGTSGDLVPCVLNGRDVMGLSVPRARSSSLNERGCMLGPPRSLALGQQIQMIKTGTSRILQML